MLYSPKCHVATSHDLTWNGRTVKKKKVKKRTKQKKKNNKENLKESFPSIKLRKLWHNLFTNYIEYTIYVHKKKKFVNLPL